MQLGFDYCQWQDNLTRSLTSQTPSSKSHFNLSYQQILNFIDSPQQDHLLGGIYSDQSGSKSLYQNAAWIEILSRYANLTACPILAQAVKQACQFVTDSCGTNQSLYADVIPESHQAVIDSDVITALLDEPQWLAFSACYGIKQKTFSPQGLRIQSSLSVISSDTGLHPKQVPLALDGARQILADYWRTNVNYQRQKPDLIANLLICRALFAAAINLNQSQWAELAQSLLDTLLCQELLPHHQSLIIDCLLMSLGYQWLDTHFLQLTIHRQQPFHKPSAIEWWNIEVWTNWQESHLLCHTLQSHDESLSGLIDMGVTTGPCVEILNRLATNYKGIVLIQGSGYEVRYWLQQFNLNYRVDRHLYGIKRDGSIRAIQIGIDGNSHPVHEIDNLYQWFN